jgi:nucleotide-binding universal stress UspA family protein
VAAARVDAAAETGKKYGSKNLIGEGSPALKIIERAKESGRTLILMGTQGRGFVEELFLGSAAHNVARRAPLAVLFVPAQARETRANE